MRNLGLLFALVTAGGLFMFWLLGFNSFGSIKELKRRKPLILRRYLQRDASELLKAPVRGEDNIFFIESSCAISGPKQQTVSMKPRQACAVESAAYLNPKKNIYYIDTCLDVQNFTLSSLSSNEVVRQVLQYTNVYVYRVQMSIYLKGTPLEEWINLGLLNNSMYPVAHSSDVLRLITLWKYGGLYLDLDMVVMRPLDDLGWNFVVAESGKLLGNSVLSFSAHGIGHRILELCLKELEETYLGTHWSFNGPKLITRVLKRVCDFIPVKQMTPETCDGLTVKPAETFFPFPYLLWQLLFSDESELENFVMDTLQRKSVYSVHAWNKMSHGTVIHIGSRQPYAMLAARFCRRVYYSAGLTL